MSVILDFGFPTEVGIVHEISPLVKFAYDGLARFDGDFLDVLICNPGKML